MIRPLAEAKFSRVLSPDIGQRYDRGIFRLNVFGELIRDYSYSSCHAELGFLFGRNSMGTCAISSGTVLRDQMQLPRRLTGNLDVLASLFEACDTWPRCLVIVKLNSGDVIEFDVDIERNWKSANVQRARTSRILQSGMLSLKRIRCLI